MVRLNPRYWQLPWIVDVFELIQILYLSPYISPPRAILPYKSSPSSDIVPTIRNAGLLDRYHYYGRPGMCSLTGRIFPELFLKTTILHLPSAHCGSSWTYFVIIGEYRTPIKHLDGLQEERCLQLFVIQALLPSRCFKLLSLDLASLAL